MFLFTRVVNKSMKTFAQYIREYGYADMALYQAHGDIRDALESLGLATEKYDKVMDVTSVMGDKVFKTLNKIDKLIGFKKSLLLTVPTFKAKINFLKAVYNLSRHPKKISSWSEVLSSLAELSKLGLMNPMIAVPSAMAFTKGLGVKDQDVLVALLTKTLSTSYFYLETISSIMKNSDNEKIKQIANSIYKILLPKSDIKH
jgi:hypothetical protein